VLIKASKQVDNEAVASKKLMIFCGGNGAPYEYYVYQVNFTLNFLILIKNNINNRISGLAFIIILV